MGSFFSFLWKPSNQSIYFESNQFYFWAATTTMETNPTHPQSLTPTFSFPSWHDGKGLTYLLDFTIFSSTSWEALALTWEIQLKWFTLPSHWTGNSVLNRGPLIKPILLNTNALKDHLFFEESNFMCLFTKLDVLILNKYFWLPVAEIPPPFMLKLGILMTLNATLCYFTHVH